MGWYWLQEQYNEMKIDLIVNLDILEYCTSM